MDFCDVGAGDAVEGHSAGKVWRSNKKIHLGRKGTDMSCVNGEKKKEMCQIAWRKMTF